MDGIQTARDIKIAWQTAAEEFAARVHEKVDAIQLAHALTALGLVDSPSCESLEIAHAYVVAKNYDVLNLTEDDREFLAAIKVRV
jgi:hypothetical protein